MESVNIKALTEQCAAGNSDSFAELYGSLVDRVFSFVSYRTNDRVAAIEVTQDIFVELHQALRKFEYQNDAAFYGFLFTIVRRQLAKHYKTNEKHGTKDMDETVMSAGGADPELTLSVRAALEDLDEVSREIVVLHHWSRFTFAEIGGIINMTESAVRVRHHRACATLASVLNA